MKEIYLDHAATGVIRRQAKEAYISALALTGNPSSLHASGVAARRSVESSRAAVASAFGAAPGEIVFVSGGSEGNNQAVFGIAALRSRRAKRIIISDGEHPSVENAALALIPRGFEVVKIPTRGGRLDIPALEEALGVPTAAVCVMHANNETGALYDIAAVRKAIDRSGSEALFHCDAVQSFLKTEETSLIKKYCDVASTSAHKIGGPKGIGALYVRSGVKLPPLIYGGGQESGLRSGTENVAGIAAFAAACQAFDPSELAKLKELRETTVAALSAADPDIIVRTPERHIDSILSISVPGVKSEVMLNCLSAEGIYISAGSACSASRKGTSRVLEAYGMPRAELESALRISFGADNTTEECVLAAEAIGKAAKRLRR